MFVLLGIQVEQRLDLFEQAAEDFLNPFALGMIGLACHVFDEKLQFADRQHQFVVGRRRSDRRFDILVQENEPGQEQVAFRQGQFKADLLALLDAFLTSHRLRSRTIDHRSLHQTRQFTLIDEMTQNQLRLTTNGVAGHCLMVLMGPLRRIREVLDCHASRYWVFRIGHLPGSLSGGVTADEILVRRQVVAEEPPRPSMSFRQSRCSSHATPNQLINWAPADSIRDQAAWRVVRLKVPEASVTTKTSKPSSSADSAGKATHTSVTTPAMISCFFPVALTALTKSSLSQALMFPGRGCRGRPGRVLSTRGQAARSARPRSSW